MHLELEKMLVYLGTRIGADVGALLDQHFAARHGIARNVVKRLRRDRADLSVLTFGQLLWTWSHHGSTHVEDVAALPIGNGYDERTSAQMMQSAVSAYLGDAVPPPPFRAAVGPLFAVFGLQRTSTRVLVRRLGFAYAVDAAARLLPVRNTLKVYLDYEANESSVFRSYAPTGAILDGIDTAIACGRLYPAGVSNGVINSEILQKKDARLWARGVARHIECKWRGETLWAPTGVASGALLRAARPTRAWLKGAILEAPASHGRAALAGLLSGAWCFACRSRVPSTSIAAGTGVYYGIEEETRDAAHQGGDGSVDRACEEGDMYSGDAVGAWREHAEEEVDRGEFSDDEDGDLEYSEGAGDVEADVNGGEEEGGDGDADREEDFFGFNDDDFPGAVGEAEQEEAKGRAGYAAVDSRGGGGWVSPVCGACGARSKALDVHIITGGVPGEAPCTGASTTRAEWKAKVNLLFEEEGLSELLDGAELQSYDELALSIGAMRRLPRLLALDLATAFVVHWGAWSANRRTTSDASASTI